MKKVITKIVAGLVACMTLTPLSVGASSQSASSDGTYNFGRRINADILKFIFS